MPRARVHRLRRDHDPHCLVRHHHGAESAHSCDPAYSRVLGHTPKPRPQRSQWHCPARPFDRHPFAISMGAHIPASPDMAAWRSYRRAPNFAASKGAAATSLSAVPDPHASPQAESSPGWSAISLCPAGSDGPKALPAPHVAQHAASRLTDGRRSRADRPLVGLCIPRTARHASPSRAPCPQTAKPPTQQGRLHLHCSIVRGGIGLRLGRSLGRRAGGTCFTGVESSLWSRRSTPVVFDEHGAP